MSYTKQNFMDGNVLEAAQLEKMEDGILDALTRTMTPGPQGDKGEKGDTGATGAKGDTGADGKSAYAYAQEGGYTGSETEFAELLGGPLIVTVTEGDNQEMTADRNAVEIISAAESGRDVYLLVSNGGFEGTRLNYMGGIREEYDDYSMGIASFSCDYPELDNEALETIACVIESVLYQGEPYKNDVTLGVLVYPSKLPNPYTMKISGSSYDGSSEVDFTSTINSMIDAKIKALDATGVSY